MKFLKIILTISILGAIAFFVINNIDHPNNSNFDNVKEHYGSIYNNYLEAEHDLKEYAQYEFSEKEIMFGNCKNILGYCLIGKKALSVQSGDTCHFFYLNLVSGEKSNSTEPVCEQKGYEI